jgi:hypothetical protein
LGFIAPRPADNGGAAVRKSTRKMLAELAERANQSEKALGALLAAQQAPAVAGPLETLATAAVQSSAQNLTAMGEFMRVIYEVAGERAGRALGKRRAATAKRATNGKYLKNACRLCEDPGIPDPTIEEIEEHAKHRKSRKPTGAVAFEHTPNAVIAHVDEVEVQTNAAGEQQIECPTCGGNHAGHPVDPDKLN